MIMFPACNLRDGQPGTALRVAPLLLLFSLWPALALGQLRIAPPEHPRYRAVADDVYLQEVGTKVPTDRPVTAIAAWRGDILAVVDGQLCRWQADRLQPVAHAPQTVQRLFSQGDSLWLTTSEATFRFDGESFQQVLDQPLVDVCEHLAAVHGATRHDIYRWDGQQFIDMRPRQGWLSNNTTYWQADGSQLLPDPVQLGPIDALASYSGTLYMLGPGGLSLLDGPMLSTDPVDWGQLPSPRHRDLLATGSRLIIGTDRGLAVLRGAALSTISGDDGLCYEDTTCLAEGLDGDLWIGTARGAMRAHDGQYDYFAADHWLPGDHVHGIAQVGQAVFIATEGGLGIIRFVPFTLQQKATYFEQDLAARGHLRLGFVHQLYWSEEDHAWLREISDNDGGHTAHYLAAMCCKYAVTQDEQARRAAVDTFQAMRWLQTITGTEGFFARAVWAHGADQGHRATRGSGGLPAKWVDTEDGRWAWKGDTSSDEVNAHYYAVSLFHDLVARDEERHEAVRHLASITRHIVQNGWLLRDVDGQPTRWGRWDPAYLLAPYGMESRGLNGLEAQTYAWTAWRLTGDPAFKAALEQLLEWRYHTYTVRQKLTFPPESVVPWDDELAFRCFLPLISYCDDDDLKSIYLRSLARHWEVLRMQKIPYFNYLYGGLTGNDCEEQAAAEHLRAWSLDTVSHSFHNSYRADLRPEPGYTPYMGGTRAISPRELASAWGSRSALNYDGGHGGRVITPPVGWLEDYWLGRYFGMLAAPAERGTPPLPLAWVGETSARAAPYHGPPRPVLSAP